MPPPSQSKLVVLRCFKCMWRDGSQCTEPRAAFANFAPFILTGEGETEPAFCPLKDEPQQEGDTNEQ